MVSFPPQPLFLFSHLCGDDRESCVISEKIGQITKLPPCPNKPLHTETPFLGLPSSPQYGFPQTRPDHTAGPLPCPLRRGPLTTPQPQFRALPRSRPASPACLQTELSVTCQSSLSAKWGNSAPFPVCLTL